MVQSVQCYWNAVNSVSNTTSNNDDRDSVSHFLASVKDLFEVSLQDLSDSDMVCITIQNLLNQSGKPTGISFRLKDQLVVDVIWSVFERVSI